MHVQMVVGVTFSLLLTTIPFTQDTEASSSRI